MMTKNTGMFYGYNPGFIPQQPKNPAMFKNHWKFQQNQGNPAVQQQQQQSNDVNAQFWTLIFENKENGSRLYIIQLCNTLIILCNVLIVLFNLLNSIEVFS